MLLANLTAEAKLLSLATLTEQVLLPELALGLHCLTTVLHSPKVRLATLEALIVGKVVHDKPSKIIVVDIALSDDSALAVEAFVESLLQSHLHDLCFEPVGNIELF